MPIRLRLADVLGAIWGVLAILTAVIGVLEVDERGIIANVLRLAIVVLMVMTAFLLIRYDLIKRDRDKDE